jgi:malate dehydrogenase (oxaloacetate-decarboxylating)
MRLLKQYRDELCCFNDDIQGTASVCLATLLAACKTKNENLSDQTVVFLGSGSAGCGIAEQVVLAMQVEGLSEREARQRICMVDRDGLVTNDQAWLRNFQRKLAHDPGMVADWENQSLLEVVRHFKPTVLLGVCGMPSIFTEEVVKTMHASCERPLIMPLSNPTSRAEALPEDVIRWTDGQALVATGSPFAPVVYQGKTYPIAQCNNAYIFPGIGLGALAVGAESITDTMLMAASRALANQAPMVQTGEGALLPSLSGIRETSKLIAFAVARQAQNDGVALMSSEEQVRETIEANFWTPRYRHYRRRAV